MSNKVRFENFEIDNLLDITYEPKKDSFSYLEINGRRKGMSKTEFLNVLQYFLKEK